MKPRAWSRKNAWDATPRPVKAVVGAVLSGVPLPLLLGGRFRTWYRFLEDAQWWDAERIREYQCARLREILTLAYERTVYYRRTFKSVGFEPGDFRDLSDLRWLPTIDKATVREHLEEMMTCPAGSRSVDFMSTSGTGGTPLQFYVNADRSAVEFAHLSQSWRRVGYRPGMSLAVFRGNVVAADASGLPHAYDPLLRHHVYSSFHLDEDHLARYLAHMHRVRPDFIHAYPSSAATLARFLAGQGAKLPSSVRAVLLESEPIYEYQRDLMAEQFRVPIYASYGHTEKLVMAGACEGSSLYHVWPTYGYCELLKEDGNEARPGERAEIVGTGFINRVVPFIRYRTDDFATSVGTGCSACGRQHLLVTDLLGHRTHEFLVTKDYRALIAWTALNMHDDTFDGILHFQFVQCVAGEAVLNVVPLPGAPRYDLRRMQQHLDGKLRGEIEIKIKVCDSIERNPSGKKTIVRQNTPGVDRLLEKLS